MNSYQQEQAQTLSMVREHLAQLSDDRKKSLRLQISDYLLFRDQVDAFLKAHFSRICTRKCYQSRVSACCSRDGIITFFADVVINVLVSTEGEVAALAAAIQSPLDSLKCIYLGHQGCLWRIKPIVCEMFLCETAAADVFAQKPEAEVVWNELLLLRKRFTWPDRPVLFDDLERYFIEVGYSSPLMYMHNSPGLLRVKQQSVAGKSR